MKNYILLLALVAAPAFCLAQPDTLMAPPPPIPAIPPVPQAPPVPPIPTVPPSIDKEVEKSVIIQRDGAIKRILVTEGDTTIIITEDADGRETVVVTIKDGEANVDSAMAKARRAYVAAGVDRSGGYVRVEADDPDTTKGEDPVIIELKRRTYRIFTEKKPVIDDSVRFAERISELRTERRNLFTYWAGLDLGLNNWVGPDGDADLSADAEFMQLDAWRSRFFAINFMEQKIEFGSHHIGLLTGLGLEYTSYHLINNVHLAYNADSVFGTYVDEPNYTKNKLRQTGLRVPLMLEFNTKKAPLPTTIEELNALDKKGGYDRKGNFHLAMGVVGSWYFETMYKQKYTAFGDKQKDRNGGDYHLLPYRAAASVRLGWGGWNFFGEYALTQLFKDGKGPELTPFNVGLTIVGFN